MTKLVVADVVAVAVAAVDLVARRNVVAVAVVDLVARRNVVAVAAVVASMSRGSCR